MRASEAYFDVRTRLEVAEFSLAPGRGDTRDITLAALARAGGRRRNCSTAALQRADSSVIKIITNTELAASYHEYVTSSAWILLFIDSLDTHKQPS